MAYPSTFGQPCWTLDQVRKVVSLTAQTSSEAAPYFLAAHSPFRRIIDSKASGRTLTEEEIFHEIFSPARGQVQAFVKGEPGTGKSHLIRWLKLRSDYASAHKESDLHKFKLVLISRGNGSLKDALGQLVSQLGSGYQKHLDRVRTAIEKLSDETARATLLAELALEVDTRWTNERGRPPLPNSLKQLGQGLRANGFGRWMKRDGGVIYEIVKRLTEQSSVEQREHFPSFTAEELNVPSAFLRPDDNAEQVREFGFDLQEDPRTRELAAEALNVALQDAVRGMMGLTGSDLLEIFTEIRRDLGPKHSLAVFIEDVSVTGLNQDVVNAFEPRTANGLCRMVAVLGIVNTGWKDQMQENQRQRATHVFEVGGDVVTQWVNNTEDVAKFSARYLNAVRLDDGEIDSVASERFAGDVRRSKCHDCPHRKPCHTAFGKVELDTGATIGMFPFTERAPQALLARLTDTYYKSQRALLDRVLLPALDQSYGAFAAQEYPRPSLFSVSPPALSGWAGFENRYCGGAGWDSDRKARLRFLAQFWVDGTSSEQLAAGLQPLLQPLAFPKFSSAPPSQKTNVKEKQELPVKKDTPSTDDSDLARLLESLDAWSAGAQLQQDNRFRDLLGNCLSKCIAWEDQRDIPISEAKRLITGNAFPKIDGQIAKPAAQRYFVEFDRSSDTTALLQSLLMFERKGNRSWQFEHGELHKRRLSRWLRKHRDRIVRTIMPNPASLEQSAVASAIRTLALAALIRDRRQLEDGRVELLERIFDNIWDVTDQPAVLSSDLRAIVADIHLKHADLREFVVQELGAGQGTAAPKDFINPLPIFATLEAFRSDTRIDPPPLEIEQSFWKSRFLAVSKLRAYADLSTRLKKERQALAGAVAEVRAFLQQASGDDSDIRDSLTNCLDQLIQVISLQRGSQRQKPLLPLPYEEFDDLWQKRWIQDAQRRESWGVSICSALGALEGTDSSLLTCDPTRFCELVTSLRTVREYLELLDKHILEEERIGGPAGDSRQQLLQELEQLASATGRVTEETTDTDL